MTCLVLHEAQAVFKFGLWAQFGRSESVYRPTATDSVPVAMLRFD